MITNIATANIAQVFTVANIEAALNEAGYVTIHDGGTYETTVTKVEGGYDTTDATGGDVFHENLTAALKAMGDLSGEMVEDDDENIAAWGEFWAILEAL